MNLTAHGEGEVPGEDRLRSLAAAMSSGLIAVHGRTIAWASGRFADIAGCESPLALRGAPLAELLSDTGSGLPDCEAPRAVECGLERPDGESRTLIFRAADAPSRDGHSLWVVEDVTHVRMLERELLRMSQELHRANRDVTSLRERIRRESDEREELLTVVSHELRTPVTIISGYNRLLLTEQVGPLTEEQRRFLSESSKGCHRLNTFIGNLLEASRVASDGEVLEIAHEKLSPVIETVVGMLRPLLDDGDLDIEIDISPDADRARFDRLRLEQVLTNLLGNAIKFSPPGGTLEVSTRPVKMASEMGPDRPGVEIRVADPGPGVAPEDRERIFEPYIQVGEESRAGGLGLGLAICKRLIEAHGGEIAVTERVGGGSSFVFSLPLSDEWSGEERS